MPTKTDRGEHTPGPWKVITGNLVRDSHGNVIHGDSNFVRNEANAVLIASAPDLLAALKGLLRGTSRDHKHNGGPYPGDCFYCPAVAAIAKAEGR